MRAGEVLDDRFVIEQLAGSGGFLYRAQDRETQKPVAIKIIQGAAAEERSRLIRDTQSLSALGPPGAVRYLAHGATRLGRLYLAMEWLSGESLTERLSREPLSVAESIALAAHVAKTLGAVHQLGIVHRNLKPSNMILVDGAIERAMVTDFGLARFAWMDQQLTMPGALLGVPGYMAPEQARGQAHIDARADVFALGCVLYKCLTGRAALQGAGGLAVLAKVILEEPPRLHELRDDIPPELEELVFRMISKAPERRPRDGEAVAAELAGMQRLVSRSAVPPSAASPARVQEITSGERRVVCLVLADGWAAGDEAQPASPGRHALVEALRALAERHQGQLEMLDGRSPLIVLCGAVAPTDLAARAARCALAAQALLGGTPMSLVTGRAEIAERLPLGELIDRAARLLPPQPEPARGAPIRIDEVTAGLLGARFDTAEDEAGRALRGERDELETTPQLLGRPTACVGRDREIALLTAELRQCIEEPAAAVVLVTGAAGMGKSRLRFELIRALREEGEELDVWLGKADAMGAGSAFGLLANALRRALGIVDGEPLEARRRKIRERVERHATLDAPRVTAFLGELVGTPFPDEHDTQLRAARQSPMLMGDQLRLAWEDFLQAECSVRPVLLVLEDLHWGDLPTVTMIDAALRNLKDLPFMVLALGRTEVHRLFPKLWEGRRKHEVRLLPLLRRASEQLVRQALGDVDEALVATLAQRADGNPFYLEEQIRAAASGKTEGLPETVLAMVQAVLESLDPEARRVLRAASIFGEAFSHGGVAALVGGVHVEPKLLELQQREVIRRGALGASGESELRFRHSLVREAAYGMLTEHDRQLGHALAGDWLERTGDADPMALAEHFQRGGEPARAATACLHAAEHALRGNDFAAAIESGDRGLACGAELSTMCALRLVQAEAHRWRGEYSLAEQRAIEAVEQLSPGSAGWLTAITQLVTAAGKLGRYERVEQWMQAVRDAVPQSGAEVARYVCLASGATELALGGRYAAADALIEVVERATNAPAAHDLAIRARLERARSFRALANGDTAAALVHHQATLAALDQAGDRRSACVARTNIAYLNGQLGDYEAAEEALRAAVTAAERMELPEVAATAIQNLGLVLAYRDRLADARAAEQTSVEAFQRLGDPRMEGGSRCYLAMILLRAGDAEAAEREARAAVEILLNVPPNLADAVAVHARALLCLGRVDEALLAARKAVSLLESVGSEEGEARIRLIHAEVLAASGQQAEAARAITRARDILIARAAKIGDPVWRERFLHKVSDHARTLELARSWLGEPAG